MLDTSGTGLFVYNAYLSEISVKYLLKPIEEVMTNYIYEPPPNIVACITYVGMDEAPAFSQEPPKFGPSNTPIVEFAVAQDKINELIPDFERFSYISDELNRLLILNNADSHDLNLEHQQLQISDSVLAELGEHAEWYTKIWISKPPSNPVCGNVINDLETLLACVPPIQEAPP